MPPIFYFDLASPEAYLAAERVLQTMPVAAEWVPVLARDLAAPETFDAFRCAEERASVLEGYAATARARGLQPLRWPDPFPFDSELALLAATYAKSIGRVVAFSLAAFRQAYAGGRDLSVPDNVAIAGAACEIHPRALLQGAATRSVTARVHEATETARERGVRTVPAVWVAGEVFHGDDALEHAADVAHRA
jgi:2-hydroxychromene-2-carboxylate isomerase